MDDEQVDGLRAIADNVALAHERLGPTSGLDFGIDRASLVWVEGFVERLRADDQVEVDLDGRLVAVIGSFLGECVVVNAPGRWTWQDEYGWAVQVRESHVFPFTKARKQFENGLAGGDSIVSFYDIAVDYLATGKL